MKADVFHATGLIGAAPAARAAEAAGFGTFWAGEMNHDPMLALAAAASSTGHIDIGSAVVLAFARSPMVVAQQAWALAAASDGRFTLGLGTQVKPHIERRFSMPWSAPAPRMREYVQALRAIWQVYQHGGNLDFRGRHYTHRLMHPLFNPGPIDHPRIPIALSGVGPHMTRLAGELADGYMLHAFTNTAYQDKVTLPALEQGLRKSGRTRKDIWVLGYAFLAVGDTEEAQQALVERFRAQVAFYAATPMYREVLAAIGCEQLESELTALIKAGRAQEMAGLVDDAMLEHFIVRGTLEELPARLHQKYGGYFDRFVSYYPIDEPDTERLRQFCAAVNAR